MMDTNVLWIRAEGALRAGRHADAQIYLRQLVQVVERIDFEYEEWLRAFAESLRASGQWGEAMACLAYLGARELPGPEVLQPQIAPARAGDPGALRNVRLYGIYLARAGQHRAAASWFALGGMPVHQAIEAERAGEDEVAAALWARLLSSDLLSERSSEPRGHAYERALAKINFGLCLRRLATAGGEPAGKGSAPRGTMHDRSRLALAEATTSVEEVADTFESEGLRERAFDCYQLIARLGVEAGAFENIAEGYLNSVRILRDDGLKLDALRLYETFVALARDRGEHHAVAAILREAADYCTRAGLPYADDLRWRSAEAWIKAASEAQSAGHPLQIVENAYLAAAEAFASVRAFRQVAEVYRRLAAIELPGKSRERAQRLLRRLGDAPGDAPRPMPVPEFLKALPEYEEVWYVDLAEWELAGDPALVAAGVMADRRFPDFVRRNALLLVLEIERRGAAMEQLDVVRRLAEIKAYPVIAALEALHRKGDAPLREAVVAAMGNLRFKRSFGLVAQALRDPMPEVRKAAANSVRRLIFPHAFEPLRRIFEARDLQDPEAAREAALHAIGKIGTVEALDFLCDRLREGERPFVELASTAIRNLSNPDLLPYLRRQIEFVPAEHRAVLEDSAQHLEQRLR
ncbi:HEAT repeat domain-containing protein [Nannocystis sp.]|nr:HEAT repeat domain-containing protein [Nannocystis sp.]MBK7824199.1 HEAT repeat domain-containing protein [Nannocystis sp.]